MKELNEAKVLAVGPGGLDKEGKRVTPSVQPGDKVLIPQVCNRAFDKYGQALKEDCNADEGFYGFSMEGAQSRLEMRSIRFLETMSKSYIL